MLSYKNLSGRAAALVLLLWAVAGCSNGKNDNDSSNSTEAPGNITTSVTQHTYTEGESFVYLYELTEGFFATEPVGGVPRITDLQRMEEIRVLFRLSIVSEGDELRKRITLLDARYREISAEELPIESIASVPFTPLTSLINGFPENFSYTYGLHEDADIALHVSEQFLPYSSPLFTKLVDIHTWPAIIENISAVLAPGDVVVRPVADVEVVPGIVFHNHKRLQIYDRIDVLDGLSQAYFKTQVPGNHLDVIGMNTNYQLTFHVPLEGQAVGLVSTGELQEMVFTTKGDAVVADQRQLSITLQSAGTRSNVDRYTKDFQLR